jgi:Cof subfamily protein (haloacid dehalogenase superfamily)
VAAAVSKRFRLAVFDLDGTLLGPDKTISVENARAIARLRAHGMTVLLASGRPHPNVLRFHQELGLSGPIVSSNGSFVKHAETEEVWHERLLDLALAHELVALGHARGLTQIWDAPEGVFTHATTEWSEVLAARTKSPIPEISDATLTERSPFKILWIADESRIAALEAELRPRYDAQSYITITDPEYLEFSAPGVNKAAGLSVVCERLSIAPSDVIAFGDGDNDSEMLAWAGLGVAMPHSRPKALAAADQIGPESAPEVCVARAIAAALAL